ncbi:MAG TPA: maleylpyruvate isomerase family mycothiol-dependent enzyme [Acidimicrobiales bacterium]|nr:maleylpyruvate isomerase family mycothiol-dependent enzyme [Acidimicrobiales bacterium]
MDYQWIIDTLESTWRDFDHYLTPRPQPDFDTPTALPGWSVHDLIGHLVGLTRVVLGEPVPTHVGPWPEYVKNPLGELNEAFVAIYRRVPTSEVLAEFREVNRRALAELRALDDEGWEKVGWSPEGDRPFHRLQETRIVDSWIHYMDARDALGEPRDDPGVAADVVLNRLEAALPYVVGKKVAPRDGTLIRLDLTGARGRSVAILTEGGRARAIASSEQAPDLVLVTPTSTWWRRMAGRVSTDDVLFDVGTHVEGDHALARRVADALLVLS